MPFKFPANTSKCVGSVFRSDGNLEETIFPVAKGRVTRSVRTCAWREQRGKSVRGRALAGADPDLNRNPDFDPDSDTESPSRQMVKVNPRNQVGMSFLVDNRQRFLPTRTKPYCLNPTAVLAVTSIRTPLNPLPSCLEHLRLPSWAGFATIPCNLKVNVAATGAHDVFEASLGILRRPTVPTGHLQRRSICREATPQRERWSEPYRRMDHCFGGEIPTKYPSTPHVILRDPHTKKR